MKPQQFFPFVCLLIVGCFTGEDALGLPCSANSQCGNSQSCLLGICSGPSGDTGSGNDASTSGGTTSSGTTGGSTSSGSSSSSSSSTTQMLTSTTAGTTSEETTQFETTEMMMTTSSSTSTSSGTTSGTSTGKDSPGPGEPCNPLEDVCLEENTCTLDFGNLVCTNFTPSAGMDGVFGDSCNPAVGNKNCLNGLCKASQFFEMTDCDALYCCTSFCTFENMMHPCPANYECISEEVTDPDLGILGSCQKS